MNSAHRRKPGRRPTSSPGRHDRSANSLAVSGGFHGAGGPGCDSGVDGDRSGRGGALRLGIGRGRPDFRPPGLAPISVENEADDKSIHKVNRRSERSDLNGAMDDRQGGGVLAQREVGAGGRGQGSGGKEGAAATEGKSRRGAMG